MHWSSAILFRLFSKQARLRQLQVPFDFPSIPTFVQIATFISAHYISSRVESLNMHFHRSACFLKINHDGKSNTLPQKNCRIPLGFVTKKSRELSALCSCSLTSFTRDSGSFYWSTKNHSGPKMACFVNFGEYPSASDKTFGLEWFRWFTLVDIWILDQ